MENKKESIDQEFIRKWFRAHKIYWKLHFDKLVFETIIPRNVRLSEAPSFGLPINKHDTQCIGATAYRSLAKEFIDRQKTKLIEQIPKPSLDEIPPSELSSSV